MSNPTDLCPELQADSEPTEDCLCGEPCEIVLLWSRNSAEVVGGRSPEIL